MTMETSHPTFEPYGYDCPPYTLGASLDDYSNEEYTFLTNVCIQNRVRVALTGYNVAGHGIMALASLAALLHRICRLSRHGHHWSRVFITDVPGKIMTLNLLTSSSFAIAVALILLAPGTVARYLFLALGVIFSYALCLYVVIVWAKVICGSSLNANETRRTDRVYNRVLPIVFVCFSLILIALWVAACFFRAPDVLYIHNNLMAAGLLWLVIMAVILACLIVREQLHLIKGLRMVLEMSSKAMGTGNSAGSSEIAHIITKIQRFTRMLITNSFNGVIGTFAEFIWFYATYGPAGAGYHSYLALGFLSPSGFLVAIFFLYLATKRKSQIAPGQIFTSSDSDRNVEIVGDEHTF